MSDLPTNDQIKIGSKVAIETKEDQGTGKLTEGIVKTKLTSSNTHPHGIKVELEDGSDWSKMKTGGWSLKATSGRDSDRR